MQSQTLNGILCLRNGQTCFFPRKLHTKWKLFLSSPDFTSFAPSVYAFVPLMHCLMDLETLLFIDSGSSKEQLGEVSQKEKHHWNLLRTLHWLPGRRRIFITETDLLRAPRTYLEGSNILKMCLSLIL